jgi:hypothetical protein
MRKLYRLLTIAAMLLISVHVFAQEKSVSGTVVSEEGGEPLEGVTVTNEKTKKSTTTNTAGYFTLRATKGDVLAFTYVGFSRKTATVGDAAVVNMRLTSGGSNLDEVVVTAYGISQRKSDLTYKVDQVSGEEIASTKRDNFINSLAGRVPGAMVTATTGMPGASSSIILRGPTSIDGTNNPIFVVDGLIIDNGSVEAENRLPGAGAAGFRNNDFGNRAMDINP